MQQIPADHRKRQTEQLRFIRNTDNIVFPTVKTAEVQPQEPGSSGNKDPLQLSVPVRKHPGTV